MPESLTPELCLQQAGLGIDWQIKPIENGLSHQHFHLCSTDSEQQLVLRLYRQQQLPWLDVAHELQVLAAAAKQQLAPELVYVSAQQDFFFARYIAHQPLQALSLVQLSSLVTTVAQLPITRPMSLSLRYHMYLQQGIQRAPDALQSKRSLDVCQRAEQALKQLAAKPWRPVPCYLDWHEQNLLAGQEKLYLIDYEYACLSALPLELASLYESGLVPAGEWPELNQLMQNLHAQSVSDEELTQARILFLSLCYLWYLAHGVDEPRALDELAQRLRQI